MPFFSRTIPVGTYFAVRNVESQRKRMENTAFYRKNQGIRIMKIIGRLFAALLFIAFFGFALKNTQEVALRFFWDYEMRGPLVLLLLGFFAAGATLGILAMTPMAFRHRRELNRKDKQIASMQEENAILQRARTQPPQADSIANP